MRQLVLGILVSGLLTGLEGFFSFGNGQLYNKTIGKTNTADTTINQISIAKQLIASSDCRACHNLQTKAVGPAYKEIAEKYKGDKSVTERLARKVIMGGNGVWGESSMSAHPGLSLIDATRIVTYILSLSDDKAAVK